MKMENKMPRNSPTPINDPLVDDEDYQEVISNYYSGVDRVKSLIALKVDTKMADTIASKISQMEFVKDVHMVTGDVDILLRTEFDTYENLRKFIITDLGEIRGIKDTRTMMIVTTFKENGKIIEN